MSRLILIRFDKKRSLIKPAPRRRRGQPARGTEGWPGVLELRLPGPPLFGLPASQAGLLLWLRRGRGDSLGVRALRGRVDVSGALPPRTWTWQAQGVTKDFSFFWNVIIQKEWINRLYTFASRKISKNIIIIMQ